MNAEAGWAECSIIITLNKFLYANSNPIRLVDYSGKFPLTETRVVAGIGAITGIISTSISQFTSHQEWSTKEKLTRYTTAAFAGAVAGPIASKIGEFSANLFVTKIGPALRTYIGGMSAGASGGLLAQFVIELSEIWILGNEFSVRSVFKATVTGRVAGGFTAKLQVTKKMPSFMEIQNPGVLNIAVSLDDFDLIDTNPIFSLIRSNLKILPHSSNWAI